jgi:V/A-type H+-transporting ATPase subunit I
MFYPQAMTEVELIIPSRDLLDVTKVLSGQGIFHQADSSYMTVKNNESGAASNWQEKASAYAALERHIQSIMLALSMDEGQPVKKEFESLTELDKVRPVVDDIEKEVKQTSDQMNAEHKKLELVESNIRQLEPVAEIDLDISALRSPRYLFSMLGLLPVANIERLQTSLERIPNVFLTLRQDNQKAVVWLTGSQNNADILERAARSAYLNPLTLPEGYQGTPGKIIQSLHDAVGETQREIKELKETVVAQHNAYVKQLQALLWDVRASRMLTDAIVRFGQLRYTYLIVGWVPTRYIDDFTERIKAVSKDSIIESFTTKRGGDNQAVPVALDNPRFLNPFQSLVTTYGRPRYGEIDPTWLMTIMFPLLFGAMFGDLGQGLVLAGLGWLLSSRKVKALNSMAGLGGVVMACGLVAAFFGLMYGSFFGFEDVIPALWMQPINNIMTILKIAIGAGLILLNIAFLLGIYNAYVARDWGHFFFDHNGLAGLVLYWGLLGLLGKAGSSFLGLSIPVPTIVFIVLAVVGGFAVTLSEVFKHLIEGHRPLIEGGIATYAIQAFFELFESLVSYLSNSLSFVRVGAFAVAHGGLSSAIFILAALMGGNTHGLGYWLVVIIGNIFITGFEGLIVGIQTMRLSYYEMFSKFFTGGGTRYEPLALYPSKEN